MASPRFANLFRWATGILLIGHGLIHAMGPLDIWGIADVEELTGEPAIDIGSTATSVLAAVWLLAFVVLVVAGLGVLARRAWWRRLAVIGVILSQFVIIVWWGDAAAGTFPNLLVVIAVVLARPLGLPFGPSEESQ